MLLSEDDPKLLVHAHADGELDPANARAIERRIQSEPALAAKRDRVKALQQALRSKFPLTPAPEHLRERIERIAGAPNAGAADLDSTCRIDCSRRNRRQQHDLHCARPRR
jgi:anti-sigma factor RsiW